MKTDKIYYTITHGNYDVINYGTYEILMSGGNQITIFLN